MIDRPTIDRPAIDRLRAGFRGEVLTPEDPGYDAARRVFNAMIDHRPVLIARCARPDDVVRCVGLARERDLPVSVRGGGHAVSGKAVADGGLMVDLSGMKRVAVDPGRRTARAGPGLTLGDLDRETQRFGLATPLGIVSNTGIAGLTLGGGIGWLNGRFGLACDNVVGAEVVTADGRRLRAGPDENPDLFWGIRGGGGNFGVVTSFEYRLHPVDRVVGGLVLYPWEGATGALRRFFEAASEAPDELCTLGLVVTGPDGRPAVGVAFGYSGPPEEADRVVAPLRGLGPPLADLTRPMSYLELQTMLDGSFTPGLHHYWKSSFLRPPVPEEAVEVLVGSGATRPSPMSALGFQQMHGAAARVGGGETAFAHRHDQFDCLILSVWSDPADTGANVRWAQEVFDGLRPFLEEGVYVNNLGEEGTDRVRAAYGANYDRLVELKRKYDPDNVFRLNQNIPPG
jgi:FAD/FMN-containing dehydrogenase